MIESSGDGDISQLPNRREPGSDPIKAEMLKPISFLVADFLFSFFHTLEDTIKNLKHGSDTLASILCDYRYCTTQKLVVLTGHIIKNKLTIMKYSPGNSSKWVAVEVRSCTIPLAYENRKEAIKLYEAFAYIYLTLEKQMKVYDRLADERLGFTVVEEEDID